MTAGDLLGLGAPDPARAAVARLLPRLREGFPADATVMSIVTVGHERRRLVESMDTMFWRIAHERGVPALEAFLQHRPALLQAGWPLRQILRLASLVDGVQLLGTMAEAGAMGPPGGEQPIPEQRGIAGLRTLRESMATFGTQVQQEVARGYAPRLDTLEEDFNRSGGHHGEPSDPQAREALRRSADNLFDLAETDLADGSLTEQAYRAVVVHIMAWYPDRDPG